MSVGHWVVLAVGLGFGGWLGWTVAALWRNPVDHEIADLLRYGFIDEEQPCTGDDPDCYECRAVRLLRALGRGI